MLLFTSPLTFLSQNVSKIFPPSTGGAEKMAHDMGVTYLGEIELDPRLGQSCDSGKSFIVEFPDSGVAKSYKRIIESKLSENVLKTIVQHIPLL